MEGTLVQRPVDGADSMELANQRFDAEKRQAIARFLDIEAEDPALVPYLGICARYGLDPVMGQVWLIPQKIKGKDGNPDKEILRPAVGRDGLLAVARRTPEFEGMASDVVCARDEFFTEWDDAARDTVVYHKRAPKPTEWPPKDVGEGETPDPGAWRGPIVGAWAKVYIKGHLPTFYYAPLREHGKTWESRDGKRKGWSGAWTYTSTMILKSAQSVALRLATGITGIVPADELKDPEPQEPGDAEAAEVSVIDQAAEEVRSAAGGDLPEDLVDELEEAVRLVNELEPFAWAPAKIRMQLADRTEEQARVLLRDIRSRIETLQASAAAEVVEEEEVAEAEVIEEEAPEEPEVESGPRIVAARDIQPGNLVRLFESDDDFQTVEDVALADDAVTLVWADGATETEPGRLYEISE